MEMYVFDKVTRKKDWSPCISVMHESLPRRSIQVHLIRDSRRPVKLLFLCITLFENFIGSPYSSSETKRHVKKRSSRNGTNR